MLARRPLALALLLVSAACGKSREEEEFDRVAAECRALVAEGATLRDAQQKFPRSGDLPIVGGPVCIAQLAPMGGNDTCAPSSQENPQCQVFFYWYPVDPGLCEVSGCWLVCEMRVMRQDPAWGDNPSALDAKICASRFLRGQPTP
ncbi:hypothetical protein [Anaeromyxobacter sp. Fw109-5]|uniref:hypothetical protein n=1 Tax=Anaeromyxobacter sp. (strain Fw109-5) TaxID=404589 RepID=UPI0002D3996B|nr:hypothetical protein [Anaeromyxobacter sp. Fw109-5]